MTRFGILFPKRADDHAYPVLPKEVQRVLDHQGITCTPPLIPTGVEEERCILVFHVLDIKGSWWSLYQLGRHLSPGSTQKSNECKCHDFKNKKGKDFFVQSTIYNMCCIK